jgi:hypothetical protein
VPSWRERWRERRQWRREFRDLGAEQVRDRVHAVIWSEEKHRYASEWLERQDRRVGADPLVLVFMAISATAAIAGAVVAIISSLR